MNTDFQAKRQAAAVRLGIDPQAMPRHVAIIMDGNGRWATNQGLPRFKGHEEGGKTVENIAMYGVDIGIEFMTLYSFSMQNWKRPAEEVDFLMYLYASYLEKIRPNLSENNVRLIHVGSKQRLPEKVISALEETEKLTENNTGMTLGLALNYGSRNEIIEAVRSIADKCSEGTLNPEEIDEKCISDHLYTSRMPDPDLVIRTSGELRISNFLLWQISYAEFYVTDTLWPDFDRTAFDHAIIAYSSRSRRFGDVNAQQSK